MKLALKKLSGKFQTIFIALTNFREMIIAHSFVFRLTFIVSIFQFIHWHATSQSVLLIRSNTTIYDSYEDHKVGILKLKEDTWVNYKGKYAEFFKVSNFFGKDEYYPDGIFEGYVQINSVLDTSNRKEYKNLLPAAISAEPETPISIIHEFDIDKFYLGMPEEEAKLSNKPTISLSGNKYNLKLHYNAAGKLDRIEMSGAREDAMAIDASIKQQIMQLRDLVSEKNYVPTKSINYPSFLELDDDIVNNIYRWELPAKLILIGIGEDNALYYSSLIFILK